MQKGLTAIDFDLNVQSVAEACPVFFVQRDLVYLLAPRWRAIAGEGMLACCRPA